MKTSLLIIIGIIVVIAISLSYYAIYESSTTVFISCDPRYEQIDDKCVLKISETDYEELECLRLYKDIREISRTDGMTLAERETIDMHKSLVFEYVEKDCPDFPDLEFIYNNYKQNISEPEPERDSAWMTGAEDELYSLGCDKPILEHLLKYSNLLDYKFDGYYAIEDIGLPDGVSKEQFEWCVDFIYEARSSIIISELHNLNTTERDEFITKYTNTVHNGEFHSQVYITDLQNEYPIGESITFTVATWGYGHPCQSPSFVYYYETKDPANIVFEDEFRRLCQVLDESDYTNYYQELDSNRTDKALNDDVYPVFDKPGSYIVSVDDKAEYEFQIIEMK